MEKLTRNSIRISVCLASYNGAGYIDQQISSILAQLRPNDELIISDDGSTDKTIELVQSISDTRIKLIFSNKGNILSNFENALLHARGEYIFFSDQDDIWRPDKVTICLHALESATLVFSNALVFTDDINKGQLLFRPGRKRTGFIRNFIKNNFVGATMAFRRSIMEKSLPFPAYIPMHDVWIGLLAEYYAETRFIEEPLIFYRRHGLNATETGARSPNPFLRRLKIRIHLAYELSRRILLK